MKKTMFALGVVFACAFVTVFQVSASAQEKETTKIRDYYFNRDFEEGYVRGKNLVKRFPQTAELRFWFILNMARSDMTKEAVKAADDMLAADSTSAWSWMALAGALNLARERKEEALAASEKALALLPDHPDMIWMRAETLMRQNQKSVLMDFVDNYRTRLENPAELLATKGNLLTFSPKDAEQLQEGLKIFEEARQIDPTNVSAHFIPGSYLTRMGRHEEALVLLEKALALSPASTSIHQRYWAATSGLKNLPLETKRQKIENDVAFLLEHRGDHPNTLFAVVQIYRKLKLAEKQQSIADKILAQFPESSQAEWILVDRYREFKAKFGKDGFKDAQKEQQYRTLLTEFIQRPNHYLESLKGDAYRSLFFSIKDDSTVAPEMLLETIQGMVKYEKSNLHITYALSAITLAERKVYFREAEQLARDGMVEAKRKIDSRKDFFETEQDYQKNLNWMTGMMYDALGWVFYHENRLAEAEKELLHAFELDSDNLENLHHLGQLYEARKLPDKAEEFYIKGLAVQRPGKNPCEQALENLYRTRHGSLSGFEEYLGNIKARDQKRRKKEILAARIIDPEPAELFKLKALTGNELALADFKGKIVVINYWGIWCYWCVKEMPDLQKLHETYQSDPEVVILTINNDPNPDDVPPWMKKNGYDFTVLFDDGYVSNQAKIHTFPTTWFVDKQGWKAFIKKGWSEKLFEEFTWRIEALKATGAQVKK